MQSSSINLASPSMALASDPALASAAADLPGSGLEGLNMSSLQFDAYAYSLNTSQTGCFRPGAIPVALAGNDTCSLGFYCPNSTNSFPPQYCPPQETCQVVRSNRGICPPQGILEPQLCAKGHFCPAGGKSQVECPKGSFCPLGAYEPVKCDYGAICPAGSSRQLTTIPLFLVVAIDVVLALFVLAGVAIDKYRKSRPKRYTTLLPGGLGGGGGGGKGALDDDVELLRTAAAKPGFSRPPLMTMGSSPSLSISAPSPVEAGPRSGHVRRASGRVERYDGYGGKEEDEDAASFASAYDPPEDYEEEDRGWEEDLASSPDMQRFLRSMSRTVQTSSIGLSFDFEDLSFDTPKGKKILQGITGTMPRGSCWGVMGGSGAGKSTFLNVLMGKLRATGGAIKINGHYKDMSKYKKLIGYVPQDDIVFPELTVRENILHSARVRLPARWRDKEIQDHVDALIACLQLTHVQHSRVGDATQPVISGGQRKRVNIGMELAAAPMAVFLDEPTSGLDATSAATIMGLLKAISRLGVTTIAIIHQPREQIFYGFDQLLLLSQGKSVYSGATEDVQDYFESMGFAFPQRANPADTLIDIVNGDGARYTVGGTKRDTDVSTLIETWKNKGQYFVQTKHLSVDGASAKRMRRVSNYSINSTAEQEESLRRTMKARGATWPAQVYYCWKRAMTQQVRNSTSFFFEIGVGALAGIIIGLSAFAAQGKLFQGIYHPPFTILSSGVDYASTPQIGLLGAMAIGLAASAPGFWVFGEEKMMYWRETASGHSRSAYYVGKLLSTLIRIGLSSLHFTVFLGVLATPLISFQNMYAANLMYFWCIYGLASIVSMLVKRENGPLLAVLASLVIGVLGGVAPPLSKVKMWHMEWFWRLSPGVWFTEAYWTQNLTPLGFLYELQLASKVVGFTLGQFSLDIAILFVIGCVYRVVAYFGLILVDRNKQR